MNKFIKAIAVAGVLALSLGACTKVAPNEVGVMVTNYGRDKAADFNVVTGQQFALLPGTSIYVIPTHLQRQTLAAPIKLKAKDNTEFTVTPNYSFRVNQKSAVNVLINNMHIAKGNPEFLAGVADNILEPRIVDILKEQSRGKTTEELMNNGGSLAFEKAVTTILEDEFSNQGLVLETFSVQLDFPATVNARIEERTKVNTNISVIDQQIEEQKKRMELEKLKTETNKIVSDGLTNEILQQQFIEKWDGKTPLYGNTPISIMKQEK